MGRNSIPLTPTQEDDALFEKFRATIRRIGIRKLASYGLLSHETINNYCRRKPVSEALEGLITQSIAKYHTERSEKAEPSKEKVRRAIALV
ncbi:hypothetical protein [Spirosoma spitsbergense]|uniref:hypothetical protein n=1 Tax=Spirosoma spitsbergense TaxID=431554 RepID=UPI0003609D08|nr:hypothetical protein [Spirosoma spitsbergense]